MSRGVTPSFRPPSVIEQFFETGVRMPMRLAVRAMSFSPTFRPTCA